MPTDITPQKAQDILHAYISKNGLKVSRQREVIAEVFLQAGGHLKIDELLERARKLDERISQATVYRTMKLLAECGLAESRTFHDGFTRYELADGHEEHHDHLICTSCGIIVEFMDDAIEARQEAVAKKNGFDLRHHRMELYGHCRKCRE